MKRDLRLVQHEIVPSKDSLRHFQSVINSDFLGFNQDRILFLFEKPTYSAFPAQDMDLLTQAPTVDDKNRIPECGDAIDVWWDDRSTIYRGRLGESCEPKSPAKSRKPRKRFRHTVYYDDGDVFVHDLNRMKWRFVDAKCNMHGIWIRPGDLELRASRALKAAYHDNSPTKTHVRTFIRKDNQNPPHSNVRRLLERPQKPTDLFLSFGGTEGGQKSVCNSDVVTPHVKMDAIKQDCKRETPIYTSKDTERGVLEALLMLSDNANIGLLPQSPLPYRKRHYAKYISSTYEGF